MMSASVLADKIDEIIGAELSPLGFEQIRPRRWVATAQPPIRRIFEFQALKGATYSARWGLSLDFVPLWRADGLRWKRTAKTANFDLCIDPIDQYGGPARLVLLFSPHLAGRSRQFSQDGGSGKGIDASGKARFQSREFDF
jgi:hypothetical protein